LLGPPCRCMEPPPEPGLKGGPDGLGRLRSSLKGSSFFGGLPLSLLGPWLSLGGPRPLRGCPSVGERELAEDTGLAKSAYMSSESALRTELLLDDADDSDDTLLTLRDLDFLDLRDPERDREPEEDRERELEPV